MKHFTSSAAALLAVALLAVPASAQNAPPHTAMKATAGADLQWSPAEIEGFDPGMMITVISGDPSVADEPYVLRLKFPDGYRFPAHWHPVVENLTVLSGTFLLKPEGEHAGPMVTYQPGDYLYIPARNAHSGGATGETVIQLHGMGPFQINLGLPTASDGDR